MGKQRFSPFEEQLLLKNNAFAALWKENMDYQLSAEDDKIKLSESEKAVGKGYGGNDPSCSPAQSHPD